MKEPKQSITLKVLLGYLLLSAFGVVTIWFIYNQTVNLNRADPSEVSNKKLTLISEVAARLYNSEGISRKIIQDRDTSELSLYYKNVDTIALVIDSLKVYYDNETTQKELDSIHSLLDLTRNNLAEIIAFRQQNDSKNYYDRVLKRLEETDYLFGSTDYKEMVKDLEPYQQKVLVDFLEYAEKDNADRLTNRTVDSLINTMKKVLFRLEIQEHSYQENIRAKERLLLENRIKISDRLRNIRAKIEQEEVQNSLLKVEIQQKTVNRTLRILILFGIASIATILAFIILIIKDTNKSQQYREELERSKDYAEQLLKSREQIMAAVTHDLRSPLNNILGYSDLLQTTELTAKQKVYFSQLKKSSDYTIRLVNDLLDFSRLDAGKIAIEKLPFIPKTLIEDCVHISIPQPDAKQLKITMDLSEKTAASFVSDPFRIRQILSNIIGNAYKFTAEGEIEIKADIREEKTGKHLHIDVTDTGIGISRKHIDGIFNEFTQAETNTEKRFGGSGLGLAICKKLADLLGGEITVKSEPGKGSTFSIKIPVVPSGAAPTVTDQKETRIKNPSEKYVLLVDDDEAQLGFTSEFLTRHDFKIIVAQNGKEALEALQENDFDIVFTDIQMPVMDGFGLIAAIRKTDRLKNLPVIALSGGTNIPKKEYLKKGFTDYLVKPYRTKDILNLIIEYLNLELEVAYEPVSKNGQEPPAVVTHKDYDLEDIEAFADGDRHSLHTILQSLTESLESYITDLKILQYENDIKKLAFLAHKMRPMMRQIKYTSLTAPLEKLEINPEELTTEEIRELLKKIILLSENLLQSLKEELADMQIS